MNSFMKNYTKFNIVLLCVFFLSCNPKDKSCPDSKHNGIEFVNNSSRNISCNIYWNYPDTMIGSYNPLHDGSDGLQPGESFVRGAGRRTCWESVLKGGKREWVYIFDRDSLLTIPWDTVRQTNRGLLERRLIDLDYLSQNNFRIIFED